jgi:Iron-sulfur cluster-binding domain
MDLPFFNRNPNDPETSRSHPVIGRLIKKIAEAGFQPFIQIDVQLAGRDTLLRCATQQEIEGFADELTTFLAERPSRLLSGLNSAIRGKPPDAGKCFFDWIMEGEAAGAARIEVFPEGTRPFGYNLKFPAFSITDRHAEPSATDTPAGRANELRRALEAYGASEGNDAIRFLIMEGMALAVSKFFSDNGDFRSAHLAAGVALERAPHSVHLRVAHFVSECKLTGRRVPAGISGIAAIGFQPFIQIDVDHEGRSQPLVCVTQQAIAKFADELAALLASRPSRLLSGLNSAIRIELYDSSESFFDWILQGEVGCVSRIELFPDGSHPIPYSLKFPAFGIVDREAAPSSAGVAAGRASGMLGALQAYDTSEGNDAIKWLIMEGMALALSKYFGSIEDFGPARSAVRIALKYAPKSIHLRAADFALECKLAEQPVPERLVKFIGRDNGALRRRICAEPFRRFDVSPSGEVLVCCGHWLPTSIGNLMTDGVDQILNSHKARKVRASMLDGSYKYCNHLECSALIQGYLPDKDEVTSPVLRAAIDENKLDVDKVDQILFAFDQSCNLSCPSCRRERIVEKPSLNHAKAEVVDQKLLPLLKTLKFLDINPAGEIFSSKPSRRILEMVSREACPDLNIDIISNGTLFTEKEWRKLPNLSGMVRSVRISTDAATKTTFESLRRLAVWEVFIENMAFLGRLRMNGEIAQLKFSFTYQLGNLREMIPFVEFAKSFNCDFVIFERLQNLGAFTWDEFRERAVHLSEHPLHHEFLTIIADPVFGQPAVWHDFEWKGAAKMSEVDARARAIGRTASTPGEAGQPS